MTDDRDARAVALFWELAADLIAAHPDVVEGTIMRGPCLRVRDEFLALVDYKRSGLVVKLPEARVRELIASGVGREFAPAGKVFRQWLSVPERSKRVWRALLREGISTAASSPPKRKRKFPRAQR